MIRLPIIALFLAGSAAAAADVQPVHAPAGKLPTTRATARKADCRGALFVPAGKINTHGHAAAAPRCDIARLAANEARSAPAPRTGRD